MLPGAATVKRESNPYRRWETRTTEVLTVTLNLRLAPKYEELAALYFNNPEYSKKVIVAKVDATANDVPEEIGGFPTIKMFPAGAKEKPIEYSGSRTVNDLVTFIKENGKHQANVKIPGAAAEDEAEIPEADGMGKQAPAATEKVEEVTDKVKSKASEATEAVKSAVVDGDGDDEGEIHDEL